MCQISQRAAAPVHREDQALNQHQPCEEGCPTHQRWAPSEGNRHDASREEEANRRVQERYRYQDGDSVRLGFMRNPSLEGYNNGP